MPAYSLDCPNCGAPLPVMQNQSIAICVYCNSSVQISIKQDSPPDITKIPEISPEVVDEVKRIIISGSVLKAVDYYAKTTGLNRDESFKAINAIKQTVGYNPPLGKPGILRVIALGLVCVLLVTTGIYLATHTYKTAGIVTVLIGSIFAYMNWYAFRSSLKANFIIKNGIETNAKVLKRWDIKTIKATSARPEALLIRLLLEINKENQTSYLTEANCILAEQSRSKCQPGAVIKIKYNKNDIKKVVITGVD